MLIDVSIVIPTCRRPAQLLEAVRSALAQESVGVEVVVVDDSPEGSAQDAVESIGAPYVTYVKRAEPSGGRPALVRNEGFRLARGRYVHFLDDDDRLAPGASHALVSALDQNPQAGVAFGWVVPFGDDPIALKDKVEWFGRAARIAKTSPSRYHIAATILFKGALMVNSACMIRRDRFEALGGFDPAILYYEDVDFWMRAIRKWGHVFVDRPILHYRTGASSLIHDLKGDWTPVQDAYRIIHRKYRSEHGLLEYACLKLLSFHLPSVSVSAS
jgi:GT2 family glycosyltransferase